MIAPVDVALVALLCRTADRTPEPVAGAAALAERFGARIIGSPSTPRSARYDDDLRTGRGCLLEAGGQVDDALDAGRVPVVFAGDCAIAVSTLPVVARHRPDAWVLWLDAHADFNTPQTSPSGYLGGMGLAAACGLWDAGFGAGLDPAQVAMIGVRDVDGGERVALDTHGVGRPDDAGGLAGLPVFLHVDLDVLDPDDLPSAWPVAGGLSFFGLYDVLTEVVGACEVVGAEVTGAHPDHVDALADALGPLTG